MKWMEINEARRNPEQNPRQRVIDALQKYKGKGLFASFTMDYGDGKTGGQTKLGINPKSGYNTPVGIYSYPVDYIFEYFERTGNIAPYTGNREWKYLYVFRAETPETVIDFETDLSPFWDKLAPFSKQTDISLSRGDLHDFWTTTKLMAEKIKQSKPSAAWNAIMRAAGVSGVANYHNEGVIHPNEPTQAVFFTKSAVSVVDLLTRDATLKDGRSDVITRMVERNIEFSVDHFSTRDIAQALENIKGFRPFSKLFYSVGEKRRAELKTVMVMNNKHFSNMPSPSEKNSLADLMFDEGLNHQEYMNREMVLAFGRALGEVETEGDLENLVEKLLQSTGGAYDVSHYIGQIADKAEQLAMKHSDMDAAQILAIVCDAHYARKVHRTLDTPDWLYVATTRWVNTDVSFSMEQIRELLPFERLNGVLCRDVFANGIMTPQDIGDDPIVLETIDDIELVVDVFGGVPDAMVYPENIAILIDYDAKYMNKLTNIDLLRAYHDKVWKTITEQDFKTLVVALEHAHTRELYGIILRWAEMRGFYTMPVAEYLVKYDATLAFSDPKMGEVLTDYSWDVIARHTDQDPQYYKSVDIWTFPITKLMDFNYDNRPIPRIVLHGLAKAGFFAAFEKGFTYDHNLDSELFSRIPRKFMIAAIAKYPDPLATAEQYGVSEEEMKTYMGDK